MGILLRSIPFATVIALNVLAQASRYKMGMLQPFVILAILILAINLSVAFKLKKQTYFSIGVSAVAIVGCISALATFAAGQWYIENIIEGLYLGLFLVALIPPIFKMKPFTFEFSQNNYPPAVTEGETFLKINLILNYIWAGIFAAAIVLTTITYHSDQAINTIIATLVPIVLQLAIGIPVTRKLPDFLMGKMGTGNYQFKTIHDLFQAMPFGLNREAAKGVDTTIQFLLTGDEPTTGYLVIVEGKCEYNEGLHPSPKTTIKCDSTLWLQISNNEVSGDKSLIEGKYEIEGDATIMLKFASMFSPLTKSRKSNQPKPKNIKFEYKNFGPGKIKNIVVFDGGFRSEKFSKTTFMVNHFCEGAKQAGANVEYFKLKDLEIKECTGCYTCWTKTPGECIYKDDMAMLRKKYREADLVIFASPLFIFNVTGIMKTFMDRLLPNLEPYMLMNEHGGISHPDRYPEKGQQGFVVFSAAGFPEVEGNFDGLVGMYRCWDSHNENLHLMGEFFLTAAEIISQPVYADRKDLVADVCSKAGKQVVEEGRIDQELMLAVQDPAISKETFQMQADLFWESLDGKERYLKKAPKLV